MERNTNKVLLTVIGIAVLIVATVGATFAYFSATGGTQTQKVTTGELRVAASSTIANGTSIKPTTWENATAANSDTDIAKVGLTVNTTGTTIADAKYNISLTTSGIELNTAKTGGKLSDVKWALYDTTDLTTAIGSGDFGKEDTAATDGDVTNLTITESAITIDTIGADVVNEDSYTLYIWIENTEDTDGVVGSGAQDQLQGLVIDATLTVDAIQ